jgi:hypothetical protein
VTELLATPSTAPADDVSLVSVAEAMSHCDAPALEAVRLDANATPVILFTDRGQPAVVHYLDDPELRGYIRCNTDAPGTRCVLCDVGRVQEHRLLLPVYSPLAKAVAVLAVSRKITPKSLLPQLAPLLKAGAPTLAFVRREGMGFAVESGPLPAGVDDGAAAVKAFLERRAAGQIRLEDVFPRYDNDQLARVEWIATALALRGLRA